MSKRLVVVGGATAVAGLVLGASIVFGPPAVTGGDTSVPGNIAAPTVKAPGGQGEGGANIRGFDYTSFEVDKDGQVRGLRLRARQANLKPLGITELIAPRADIRLGPQQAITITADKADMEMEDSKPRAGQFSGNVVVTLFQAPEGVELIIDPDDPKHERFVQQRIYLDEPEGAEGADRRVNFDIEDSRINTRGPVHVTSPQVDFFGVGLRLTYNTQRERIEQLVINQGRYLIYNPDAETPGFDDNNNADAEQPEASGNNEQPTPDAPGPSQYYDATFLGQVVVRDGITSELGGDKLTIDFSLGTEAINPTPIVPDDEATAGLPALLVLPGAQLVQAESALADDSTGGDPPALPVVAIPDKNRARSLFTHDPKRDLVITWTGELRVTPHADKPDALIDAEDVHITLVGENAYAQTTRDGETDRIEMARLEYLLSEERTTASAHDDRPVRIASAALGGEITGRRLIVRQKAGNATILGPGRLTTISKKDKKPLTLTWTNQLHLELFTEARSANAGLKADAEPRSGEAAGTRSETPDTPDRTQTKILGVKTATFDGDITARHPDFDLDADKLTLTFIEPDEENKIDNDPTSISASGNVAVKARGDDEDETFDITAQRLTVDLEPDQDGDPYAAMILAEGAVRIEQPGLWMTCNRVAVELNEPSAKTEAAPEPREGSAKTASDPYAEVRSILAVGDVRGQVDHDGRRIDLVADQLIGDVENDRLTLSANSTRKPAEVFDLGNQRKITGQLIVMDNRAEVLEIKQAGSLATRIDDPDNPDAGLEDSFLNVSWTESMLFNNITGDAVFVGNVRSESRRSADFSELTCDKLVMLFSPDYDHDPARLVDDEGEDAHDRQVRSAIATGNVKFMAAAWELADPDQITNRLRLQGPTVIFTNTPALQFGETAIETVTVQGKGLMVLEDYRAPEDEDDDKAASQQASMTGRGVTLFTWEQAMVLDALSNSATLTDTVQMTHIPKDKDGRDGKTVILDCDKLVADMTDTGGLSVWLSDDAPDAQVVQITADGNVWLEQKDHRRMHGDHLKFTGEDNTVNIWSDNDKPVLIEDLERDATSQAKTIHWDLTADRIEVEDLRGGVTPLE